MKIPPISLATRATSFTSADKSNAVTITTWVTLAILVLMFLAREAIKFALKRRFAIDDLLILAATIFAIGLSATFLILASNGLGAFTVLTVSRANIIMKGFYASNFLYISSLGFAKLSLVTFFYSIHIQRTQRRIVLGFGIFILAWTIASLSTVAFQCGLPRPWEVLTLHCYNTGIFWMVYCIIDMTTDVSIIMLSVNLVASLRVKKSKKFAAVACFAPRILVIGAALVRLIYLYPITPHDDPAFNLWVPVICTQVQIGLSILTACIPFMRPFFEGAESGIWGKEQARRKRATSEYSYVHGSSGYPRGHKRGQEQSLDSTIFFGRTPEASPRIPSPAPMSPLSAPRLYTPPNTSASNSRNSSMKGLRLQIPPPEIQIQRSSDIISPQTASSHALSPECLSPQPLLSRQAFSPTAGGPSPPLPTYSPRPPAASSFYGSPDSNLASSPARFSLFPQQREPRYSLEPQSYAQTALTTSTERPPTGGRTPSTPMHGMTPNATPETRTSSPNSRNAAQSHDARFPLRKTSLQKIAYDDPLRIRAAAYTADEPVMARNPASRELQALLSNQSVARPPRTHDSGSSSSQAIPSYYRTTPPTSQPPTFPLPIPPISHNYDSAPQKEPPSPQRQRNHRILAPQNSARRHEMSPVSPMSPQSSFNFWPKETTNAARQEREEKQLPPMPVIRETRNNPRIVVQRPA